MKRERTVRQAEKELNSGGYATVLASHMHTCADVFAEKMGRKFVIKIVYNIDSITRKEAESLQHLSQFLDAEPIVLGTISNNGRLRSDVAYYRFAIRCMSSDTLPNLNPDELDLLASKSVGIKAKIDGVQMRRLRKIGNMKITNLAKMAEISRSTLYNFERTGGYASISTINKVENILKGPIREGGVPRSKSVPLRTNELASTGMLSMRLHNAPFDIVAKSKNYYEISLDANIRTLIKRASLFRAIKDTFQNNYPFFISEKKGSIGGVPAIKKKDLLKAKSEDQLLELVY